MEDITILIKTGQISAWVKFEVRNLPGETFIKIYLLFF
jgi:hypothetical protein